MRKLALSDEVLLSVQKPARYLGNEANAVYKDRGKVDIRFAMCFPDVYEVGMSHLGIQILYDMFNRREDTWCERVYSPWLDLDKILRDRKIPLFALESNGYTPRGWTLTKYCGTIRSRFLLWNHRTRFGILTSWELRSSSNSATQMCCRSWTFPESP